MNRLPIRWRLTLAFVALAIVLTAVGVFLHARLRAELDIGIERESGPRRPLGGLLIQSPSRSCRRPRRQYWNPRRTSPRSSGRTAQSSRPAHTRTYTADPHTARGCGAGETMADRKGTRHLTSRTDFAQHVQARGEVFAVVVTDH
jgi:hypothetical protein